MLIVYRKNKKNIRTRLGVWFSCFKSLKYNFIFVFIDNKKPKNVQNLHFFQSIPLIVYV